MCQTNAPCGTCKRFLADDTLRSQQPRRGVCSPPSFAGEARQQSWRVFLLGGIQRFLDPSIGETPAWDDPRVEHPNGSCASGRSTRATRYMPVECMKTCM